jgi:vesicular inhibitory amino acid transporter
MLTSFCLLLIYLQLNLTVEALLGLNPLPQGDPHRPAPASSPAKKPLLEGDSPTSPYVPHQSTEADYAIGGSSSFTIPTTGAFAPAPLASEGQEAARAASRKTVGRLIARIGVTAACVGVAILLPEFERLMAFLGSFTTFFICVLLPVSSALSSSVNFG